jgi:hydroxymethylpyrimidine pyrophosphatase-like HAD family hydrolase
MFQAADHAVAVANAADELLPFAHECLKTREDDSVAHYIRAHSAMH